MSSPLRSAALEARSAHAVRRRGVSLRAAVAPLDDRMVFVVGSPRSGTTFLAGVLGSCPGFVDLGEVVALKAALPRLALLPPQAAAPSISRTLGRVRRLGLVAGLRGVEQTPETVFAAAAVRLAFPRARLVHILRDGRDAVCSLLDRGWLSAGRSGADDAGQEHGANARFWVEPGRESEFGAASDARRAAWAWRRYVEVARAAGPDVEVRYEELASDPVRVARRLAVGVDAPHDALLAALESAHASSIARFERDLDADQLAEVEAEAGGLLRALGYLR